MHRASAVVAVALNTELLFGVLNDAQVAPGPEGKLVEKIDVPERPIDLIFGGADRRTLYILTQHSLYAVRTLVGGL